MHDRPTKQDIKGVRQRRGTVTLPGSRHGEQDKSTETRGKARGKRGTPNKGEGGKREKRERTGDPVLRN